MAEEKTQHKNEKLGEVVFDQDGQNDCGRSQPARAASALQADCDQTQEIFTRNDEEGVAKTGDLVRIIECRPLSKLNAVAAG